MNEMTTPKADKYANKAIRFVDKGAYYELIFTDDFNMPSSGGGTMPPDTLVTDIITDLRNANKDKELHIFVGSYGGYVSCLNMLLQQVKGFKYRVGVNLGTACSCGFMLLANCDELYTSPFSEFMYHCMWGVSVGKVTEIKNKNQFDAKWWKMLVENSFIKDILTPDELKLGETSEVWLSGQDLIDRGVAMDYEQYATRPIPTYIPNVFAINDDLYRKEGDYYVKYVKEKPFKKNQNNKFTYEDILMIHNDMEKVKCNAH